MALTGVRVAADLGDQEIQLTFHLGENCVVREPADELPSSFQIHIVRTAPKSQIGIVGLTRSIHSAPHHRDF